MKRVNNLYSKICDIDVIMAMYDVLKSEIHHNRINKNNVCPEIVNLYLLRLFIIGMSTYQVCSSTKEIFASKKLSLKREGE